MYIKSKPPKLIQFKKELHDLLAKYDATIGLVADNGSDWWGITGEKLVVQFGMSDNTHDLNEQGLWISKEDLK